MASTSRGIPTGPVPEWTIREQLILASAVQRSGDQNWVSVSRAVKPLVKDVRPPDYFSQKNCALQYSAMLDKASTPKRKRSSDGAPEAVETVEEQIVRQLTEKRINELNDSIADTKEEYLALQKEIERIEKGELDDQLPQLWQEIQQETAHKEDAELKTKEVHVLKLKSQPPSNLAKYQEQLKLRRQPQLVQEAAMRAMEGGKPAAGTSGENQEPKGIELTIGRGSKEAVRQLQVHKMEVPPTEPAPTTPTQPTSIVIKKEPVPVPAEKRVVSSPIPLMAEESPFPKPVTTPKEELFGQPIRAGQPSTNVSLQQLASDVHIIVQQPNFALAGMAGVTTTIVSASTSAVTAVTANSTRVAPTSVTLATAKHSVATAVSSEARPPVVTPPVTVVPSMAVPSRPPPLTAEKIVPVASMRPIPKPELPVIIRQEPVSRPIPAPVTMTTPSEVKPPKESKMAPPLTKVAPETVKTVARPPPPPREEPTQPMETTATPTEPNPVKPVKPVPEPTVLAPTVTATVVPVSLHKLASPPPALPPFSAEVSSLSNPPPVTTIRPPEPPAGTTIPETTPPAQPVSSVEKSQQSPIKLEEKAPDREEVESEKQPSDVKPLTPAEAMEQEVKEVKEEAVAEEAAVEETTTDRQQEEPKKVEENVETVSQEKPESSEEVVKTQETTEQSMETEPKEEPQPASQTEETPPSPKPSSPPAIVVTEAKSPIEEARSPRSSISPSPSGGRVTRRSGSKRREAGLARETPQREGQREGSAQETEEQQQTPQPENLSPGESHSPPSGSRRPRPSAGLTPLPEEEEEEEEETPIRKGRSSRTPFKKQWITRSRKRRAAEMDEVGGHFLESPDFESEDEPISSQPSTAAPSPAPSQSDVDPEVVQAQRQWRKAIMLVWRHAAQHKYANLFLHPVKKDDAPGYTDVIFRPMDLYSIKRSIENGVTKTDIEFQRDMLLVFQNAFMYNSSDHEVYMMAEEMKADVMDSIQDYLATQAQLQLMEDSSGPKLLRSREGRRVDPHEEGVFSPAAKKRRTRADD